MGVGIAIFLCTVAAFLSCTIASSMIVHALDRLDIIFWSICGGIIGSSVCFLTGVLFQPLSENGFVFIAVLFFTLPCQLRILSSSHVAQKHSAWPVAISVFGYLQFVSYIVIGGLLLMGYSRDILFSSSAVWILGGALWFAMVSIWLKLQDHYIGMGTFKTTLPSRPSS